MVADTNLIQSPRHLSCPSYTYFYIYIFICIYHYLQGSHWTKILCRNLAHVYTCIYPNNPILHNYALFFHLMHKKHALFKNVDNFIFWSLFSHSEMKQYNCLHVQCWIKASVRSDNKQNIVFYNTVYSSHHDNNIHHGINKKHSYRRKLLVTVTEWIYCITIAHHISLQILFYFTDPLWKLFFFTFVVEKLRDLLGSGLKWILNTSQKMTAEQFENFSILFFNVSLHYYFIILCFSLY